MLKKELRKKYSALRKNIPPEQISSHSIAIANRALKCPIWTYEYYHIYLPIEEKTEVDTSYLLSILQGKDKNIVLPKMEQNRSLTNYLLTDNTILKKNSWNVPEPQNGLQVPSTTIDLVFMPLLAFDEQGNRVGYGKGFYDTFLKSCKPQVLKVGLSFFEAESQIADVLPTDIPMDYCVTPTKIYKFS
ncbi:5-formyltetrahydrofolate cyclo-ligase [Spongiimicrobium salis]|uniref:5-formyltetrahydrofolate cyclo-ligase n=1 Tax=Spongiimicrobium salis TaxID=1667022 RepID=UPI00374DAB5F